MSRARIRKTGVIVIALATAASALMAQTVLSNLGVGETHAHEIAMSAIEGSFGLGNVAKPFLALAPAARGAAVSDVIAWAKGYFSSPAFKKSWADLRAGAKPEAPKPKPSADEQSKDQAAEQQKQIEQMRKAAASLPPDQRKMIEDLIAQQTAQMAALAKDPQYQATIKQAKDLEAQRDQTRYQDDQKKWELDYPADPNVLIARRLRDFLAFSADVNFDAKVVVKDGRKVFVDPTYEGKPADWKMCYRAGREATTAARAGATAWLKELGQ